MGGVGVGDDARRRKRSSPRDFYARRGARFDDSKIPISQKDVTEFMNLLIAFVRSGPSSSDASGEDSKSLEYRLAKAR